MARYNKINEKVNASLVLIRVGYASSLEFVYTKYVLVYFIFADKGLFDNIIVLRQQKCFRKTPHPRRLGACCLPLESVNRNIIKLNKL